MEVINQGYTSNCKNSLGGLNNIYLFTFKKYSRSQIETDVNVLTSFPSTTIYAFEDNFSATFDNKGNEDEGGKYYTESLNFTIVKTGLDYNFRKFLQQDLRAIVRDRNGKLRILGLYNGLECDSINATTGTTKNSLNGYTISLSGQEEEQAYYIDDLYNAGFTIDGEFNYLLQENGDYLLQEDGFRILL